MSHHFHEAQALFDVTPFGVSHSRRVVGLQERIATTDMAGFREHERDILAHGGSETYTVEPVPIDLERERLLRSRQNVIGALRGNKERLRQMEMSWGAN